MKRSSNNQISNSPGGLLVRFIYAIRKRLRLTDDRMNLMTGKYAIKVHGGSTKDRKDSSMKGNLLDAFKNSDKLSIINFFRFLEVLETKEAVFELKLTLIDDSVHDFREVVDFTIESNSLNGNTAGGTLIKLLTAIRKELNLTDERMNELTGKYTARLHKDSKGGSSTKGNFLKFFRDNERLTIINFFRFLATIETKEAVFGITIKLRDDSSFTFTEKVGFGLGSQKE